MAHFGARKEKPVVTPPAWYQVNSEITGLVADWSGRNDLIVSVGPDAGGGTAFFVPTAHEIQVNTEAAFGLVGPEYIGDLRTLEVQREFPAAAGAILHECMHARNTLWSFPDALEELGQSGYETMHLLEEGRIENIGVEDFPVYVPFLRACAMGIALKDYLDPPADMDEPISGTRAAARVLLLAMARVDAGSLSGSDVLELRKLVSEMLDEELIKKLREIWVRFQRIRDYSPQGDLPLMYQLTREWEALIDEAAKSEDQSEAAAQQFLRDLANAMAGAAGDAQTGAAQDIQDQKTVERREEKARQKAEDQKQKGKAARASEKVFGSGENKQGGQGLSTGTEASKARVVSERVPTSAEKAAAAALGRALEKAKYHDRVETISRSTVPPGRLRVAVGMQQDALRSAGRTFEASRMEPWRKIKRRNTIDPNLTVGVMTDVSGSMSQAVKDMAICTWMLAEAVARIGGKASVVYFGNSAQPGLYPGQRPDVVSTWNAPDGREAFEEGFLALDGKMNLLRGTGARMLVVVSDGWFKNGQREKSEEYLKRCVAAGVAVTWIGYGDAEVAEALCARVGGDAVSFVNPAATAIDTGSLIGQAAVRALTVAGSNR